MNASLAEVGKMKRIGILALQGAVAEHMHALSKLQNVTTLAVKTIDEIKEVDGLILPGGESTAMGKLLDYFQMLEPLKNLINQGLPVWGTCAGMILLAKEISAQETSYLQAMDTVVKRNGYGSQLDSFQTTASIPEISATPIPLTFIRAPYIESAKENVKVLAKVDNKIVAAQQNHMLATAFHPELTNDLSFHRYFVEKVV
mgnify:CR=1 FL=1